MQPRKPRRRTPKVADFLRVARQRGGSVGSRVIFSLLGSATLSQLAKDPRPCMGWVLAATCSPTGRLCKTRSSAGERGINWGKSVCWVAQRFLAGGLMGLMGGSGGLRAILSSAAYCDLGAIVEEQRRRQVRPALQQSSDTDRTGQDRTGRQVHGLADTLQEENRWTEALTGADMVSCLAIFGWLAVAWEGEKSR
ncbi:hypothetical protein F4780DRAFT_719815 [Xylariomycetidae sp. FL0641]|nr:hypothetical protein F4780DRAFT_719815 [Xylariomycetidae sp. FL0641]